MSRWNNTLTWDQQYAVTQALKHLNRPTTFWDADVKPLEDETLLNAMLTLSEYPMSAEMEAAIRRYAGMDLTILDKERLEKAGV